MARTIAKAERSMPSSWRPASRAAPTMRSIISRRTATTTTRSRSWPWGLTTRPSGWKSRIASSIGIGMWSGASTRTVAASAFGSSIGGRSSERTTMAWFETPRRTRRGRSCSANRALSASVRPCGSATSPSRMMPGRSGATTPRVTMIEPLTLTSAAAMWLGSSSSPTTVVFLEERFRLSTGVISARTRGRLSAPVNDEAGPEARFAKYCCAALRLPAAAGGAAGAGAGARHVAGGVTRDQPMAGRAGLRRDVDRVPARAGSDGETGVELLDRRLDELHRGLVGRRVVLVVRVVGLHGGLNGAGTALGLGVLSLLTLVEEGGKRDSGKNADDQNDDQKLDQGETLLVLGALAELVEH